MTNRRKLQLAAIVAIPSIGALLVALVSVVWAFACGLALALLVLSYVMVRIYDGVQDVERKLTRGVRQIEDLFQVHRLIPLHAPLPPFRDWAISPDFACEILGSLVKLRPKLVVELGSGLSTIVTASWLKANGTGRLIALEHDAEFAELTRGWIEEHGLGDVAEVRTAPLSAHSLPEGAWQWYAPEAFQDLSEIELLTVDGPPRGVQKRSRYPVLPLFEERMAPRCRILLDDGEYPHVAELATHWARSRPGWKMQRIETEKITYVLDRDPTDR